MAESNVQRVRAVLTDVFEAAGNPGYIELHELASVLDLPIDKTLNALKELMRRGEVAEFREFALREETYKALTPEATDDAR